MTSSCPDIFSAQSSIDDRLLDNYHEALTPNRVYYSCLGDRSWLIYSPLVQQPSVANNRTAAAGAAAALSPVLTIAARDLLLFDGCFASAESLCSTYCTPAVYTDPGGSGRDIALWEAGLSLLGLLILLTTLFVICSLRLLPSGGRLATVHRQLLAAYAAYYASRTVRLLAWPAVRCLGSRSASLSLDAALEFLETLAYSGVFVCFLAQSLCLRVRLGRPSPACQSPLASASLHWKRRHHPLVELLILVWPLPLAIATAQLAGRALAPGQLAKLPTLEAVLQLRPASYYTAIVRLPLAAVHLLSMLLGVLSLRLSLRRSRRRRRLHRLLRWSRTLTLVNALSGAYLLLDLLPPGLVPTAGGARALRCVQLAANLLQSLLVTLPMLWLNRRLRRFAIARLRHASQSLLLIRRHSPPKHPGLLLLPRPVPPPILKSPLDLYDDTGSCFNGRAFVRCPVVSFLEPEGPADRLRHVDCEIDS